MGALDSVLERLPKEAPAESALLPLITALVSLVQKQTEAQSADTQTNTAIKAEVERLATITKQLAEASKDVSGAAAKGVASQVAEAIEGLEKALIAEVRAIKFPDIPKPTKQKEVDLTPVLNALKNLPAPIVQKGEAPPPQKTHWTFEFKRNKRSGLLEEVIAR